jgi:NAD(P)-dependent dehydrogenase (short-subunit alcohol dehydrogenase family)
VNRKPEYNLAERTVIITGAAGGIGAATARELVARGALVTLVDLSQDAVTALAKSPVFVFGRDLGNLTRSAGRRNRPSSQMARPRVIDPPDDAPAGTAAQGLLTLRDRWVAPAARLA